MRRNRPFFKDSDWLILVLVHSAKPTAELENLAMSPSLSSPGLSYDTKFVNIGWELRSSLVGGTILGVQSEPACIRQLLSMPPQIRGHMVTTPTCLCTTTTFSLQRLIFEVMASVFFSFRFHSPLP